MQCFVLFIQVRGFNKTAVIKALISIDYNFSSALFVSVPRRSAKRHRPCSCALIHPVVQCRETFRLFIDHDSEVEVFHEHTHRWCVWRLQRFEVSMAFEMKSFEKHLHFNGLTASSVTVTDLLKYSPQLREFKAAENVSAIY